MKNEKETYKLAKLPVQALMDLKRIVFKEGKMTTENISRNGLFSRMNSYDDFVRATRLIIPHKTDYYISAIGDKKHKKTYERVDNYDLLDNNNELRDEIEQAGKKAMITMKLSGREPVRCSDAEFANGANISFIVKSPVEQVEYECAYHDSYIRCFYRIRIPVINKNGELETKEFPYKNTVYRYAQQSQDHWIGIPKGYPYIIVNVNKDDEQCGESEWFVEAESKGVEKDLDTLVEKYKDQLTTYAKQFRMCTLIEFDDPNTQFFCQLKE